MKWSCAITILFLSSNLFSQSKERTCFQTAQPWQAELDIRSDIAIVYGVNKSFADRVKSWRDKGYTVEFMTGSAWGEYQDYFEGRFDGKTHFEEGQVQKNGETIWHGPKVPYVVPTKSFLEYLKSLIKIAIDEGAETIHLEEPEFWNRAGYSEGFKKEWSDYYSEPWQPQHESPAATYRSNKLKHFLYTRALTELITFIKDYAQQQGKTIPCFVPTHSLINYSLWHIVSPEAALAQIPGLDGYIGQVWTGTARTPIFYDGFKKERTFEAAYLEYGSVAAMTSSTGKQVYFLTDPIEDDPNHSWDDYKYNYEATFIAQLLFPEIFHFEVMPWPGRIFLHKYSVPNQTEKQLIPPNYATEILVLINALNDMEQTQVRSTQTKGIAVVQSNTLMLQSFPTHEGYEDPALANFYGLALPLVKHGIATRIVQLEHLEKSEALAGIDVLLLSYANMKPLNPAYHKTIAEWIRRGGGLIYIGRDNDPYQSVPEWWNAKPNHFAAPSEHLFQLLQIKPPTQSSSFQCGTGFISIVRRNPKEYIMEKEQHELLRQEVKAMMKKLHKENLWQEKNYFHLSRGPYEIISVLDESCSPAPFSLFGSFVDLFDAQLPIINKKTIFPAQRALLFNLNFIKTTAPVVIASASRVSDEICEKSKYKFCLKGPAKTEGRARIFLAKAPLSTSIRDAEGKDIGKIYNWEEENQTMLLEYPNVPEGIWVSITLRL